MSRRSKLGMMKHWLSLAVLCLSACTALAVSDPPRIPAVQGTTFAGRKVSLPDDLKGKVGILVIGFSQSSRDAVTTWGKKLAVDYYDSSRVLYFEMPMLASVPKLMRSFVEGRIKSSVSERGKVHFLPLTADEAAWRSLVHYSNPDVPYVLLVDEKGTIRWNTQGLPSDATYMTLKQQVDGLQTH